MVKRKRPDNTDVYFMGPNPFKEYVKLRLDVIETKIESLLKGVQLSNDDEPFCPECGGSSVHENWCIRI